MIGETLGNYRIVSNLGRGGMGAVYLAEHTVIGRKAAIKVLLPQMSLDSDLVERFFNEAKMAGKLHHPGLVEVFDFGVHRDGSAYIVMELLVGESLTQRMAASGRLSIDLSLALTRQVALALHAVHEQGIVHRDLKPENVFLLPDTEAPGGVRVKLLDFGIAKLAKEDAPRSVKTKTGAVFGTPRYMAPEQCRSAGAVDHRADIYALGCILYEMVLGVPPFDYDGWGELVAAHIHETPPRPTELAPNLAPALEALMLKMLAKRIEDRHASAAQLVAEIDALWDHLARTGDVVLTRPSAPTGRRPPQHGDAVSAPTLPVAAEIKPPSTLPSPTRSRRRYWLALPAVAVLAGVAIVAPMVMSEREAPAPVTATTPTPTPVTPAPAKEPAVSVPEAPPAPASPASSTVQLAIESIPSGATVYRRSDGIRLGRTPWVGTFARTQGDLDLRIKLSGYRDGHVTLSTAKDGKETVKLVAAPSRPHDGKTKPGAKPDDGATFLDPYGAK